MNYLFSKFFELPLTGTFENTVEIGEIARNEQFVLFPCVFYNLESSLPFSSNLKFEIVICKLFQFGSVQNLLFRKGLKLSSYS